MNSIGARLRQERLQRGLDLAQIAERTKINPAMLEAIESGDLDKLPGSFFARSFVRQYARALELDEEEFEPELKRLAALEEPPTPEPGIVAQDAVVAPVAPVSEPAGRGRSPSPLLALILIVAASVGIYVLWQKARATRWQPETRTAAAQPAAARAGAAAAKQTARRAAALPRPTSRGTTAPAVGRAPSQAPAPAAGSDTGEVKSSVAPGESAAVRVELRAKGDAWVRLVADRQVLFQGMLRAGDVRRFEGSVWMSLRIGKPEAVAITWNGQAVGDVGPPGQAQTVEFTSRGFRVVPPSPKPAAAPAAPGAP
ncbi:MAG: RodZ domain-containing protein [Bryobacteraceae bacterium]|jgi:cytoskeletal protein RodZ